MSKVEKRTVSLSRTHGAYIDEMVVSGRYASASEVVRAGLAALQERDRAARQWLHDQVGPVYDLMKAHPERAISAKEAFASVRHKARQKKQA